MQAAVDKMADLARDLGKPQSLADARRFALEQRRWFNADPPRLALVEDRALPGPYRPIPVRLYVPCEALQRPGLVVYCHGGGWFACSNDTHDRIMRLFAIASRATVLGVDYCLAPESKFPAAVEEVAAVLRWAAASAPDWGLDAGRLAVAGCSAGANLALGATLTLPHEIMSRFRAGALFYGAYDPAADTESHRLFGGEGAWLSSKEMAWCWTTYLAREADRNDPRAAPLRASDAVLSRLPPLYLCAAEIDPLRDDTLALARRLAALGMPHTLSVREGLGHSFLGFARMVDEAGAVLQDAGRFVNAAWEGAIAARERASA